MFHFIFICFFLFSLSLPLPLFPSPPSLHYISLRYNGWHRDLNNYYVASNPSSTYALYLNSNEALSKGKKNPKWIFFFYSILSTMLNWNLLLRFTEHILKSLTVFCKNRLYFSIQLVLGFSIPIIHISYNYEESVFLVLISVRVLKTLEFGAVINRIIVSILSEHSWYF